MNKIRIHESTLKIKTEREKEREREGRREGKEGGREVTYSRIPTMNLEELMRL